MAKKEKKGKKEKPLERMTAKELREYALSLGGEIIGVHGMNKEELLAAIKQVKGIQDEGKKTARTINVREIKEKVKSLRQAKLDAIAAGEPRSKITILRKRVNRLKKLTRKVA
ncbi:MAG: transcription termination factor Rho [Deltaproteobacteria bacterium]|nr:transcription termination factor Rho [Deltaproteobacteria bacterium]MBW1951742.1 transcription termination factor Rho [Deltaproteobacteria bacterium]MBW1986861.1 transcription termination factor Rho [Deltaproteobacteria bacterium]MBW2134986.1 transcription termination factor Rho [Deltaproteobacteria bacterium]